MNDNGYTVDGVELESGDRIYLRLGDEPTAGLWCSPFEVTDEPDIVQPNGLYTMHVCAWRHEDCPVCVAGAETGPE